jgi:Cu+-exporting ATPase
MAIDPICGMEVEESSALSTNRNGQVHFFCSDSCKRDFENRSVLDDLPGLVTAPDSGCCGNGREESGREESTTGQMEKYTCPMCPDILSASPGECPKCGMSLELAQSTIPETQVTFTCPMHPEIEQAEPGVCPKCGMALEAKYVVQDTETRDSELTMMTRRFWVALAPVLSCPVRSVPFLSGPVRSYRLVCCR